MNFKFSKLSDKNHTFVVAEAGSNWKSGSYETDLDEAKKLIKIATDANADAVKFQTFKSKTLYATNAGQSNYLKKNGLNQDVNKLFNDLSMPSEMIPELANYCKKNEIYFMSTPFSVEDAKEIDQYVDIHKIASYEINHIRLIEFLAKTQKPIIISTGASTYKEIDFAVKLIRKYNNKISILQCTAKYPAPIESLNLSVIPKMMERYKCPIGLSDHSIDPIIGPLTAIGFGATIIEKHFTISKNKSGPDHRFALEPQELKLMVDAIRKADKAKGNSKKQLLEVEKELRRFATRSLQAIKKIKKGDILQEGVNFDVLRPGNHRRGLDAKFLLEVNGKKAIKDIDLGEGITDFE